MATSRCRHRCWSRCCAAGTKEEQMLRALGGLMVRCRKRRGEGRNGWHKRWRGFVSRPARWTRRLLYCHPKRQLLLLLLLLLLLWVQANRGCNRHSSQRMSQRLGRLSSTSQHRQQFARSGAGGGPGYARFRDRRAMDGAEGGGFFFFLASRGHAAPGVDAVSTCSSSGSGLFTPESAQTGLVRASAAVRVLQAQASISWGSVRGLQLGSPGEGAIQRARSLPQPFY